MEIEERNCNVLLQGIAYKEAQKEEVTLRTIVPISKLTERECELIISKLLSDGFIVDNDEILKPSTTLKLSESGISKVNNINKETGHAFGSILSLKYQFEMLAKDKDQATRAQVQAKAFEIEEMLKTHMWQKMGSYADGAGQITRDKWYPMGSFCRKCGLQTKQFKKNPTVCPKK